MWSKIVIIAIVIGTIFLTAGVTGITADFSSNIITGTAPFTVSFTDQSSGTPTGWAWYFGDEDFSAPWIRVNVSAGWSARDGFSSVVIPGGSIVLTGGYDSTSFGYKDDVWSSLDSGTTWTLVNASAGWYPRAGHSSVVLPDGSVVLMGGWGYHFINDVWRSMDNGATWTLMNGGAAWVPRADLSSVVLPDGSIVLMGGLSGSPYMNDTWRSTDNGTTWTLVNESAGWTARHLQSGVVVPDGSIVLMGGLGANTNFKNDTWRSTDKGNVWIRINASAGWMARQAHSSVIMPDGSIVLTGGQSKDGYMNDVWRSTDNGATWTLVNASAGWTPRFSHSMVTMPDGSIVLMGGFGPNVSISSYSLYNDVWRVQPVGSSAQNPMHTYTVPGTYQVSLQAYNSGGYNSTRKAGYITVLSGAEKVGVFRPSTHLFYLDYNGNGAWNGAPKDRLNNFGITGDIPLTGDWNNDNKTEIGVFRPSTHLFYRDYNGNGLWNGAVIDRVSSFGITGDIPVSGDWNNNGISEIGVFRPSTHLFYDDYNGNGIWNGAVVDRSYNFGITGDIPLSGDWNWDGVPEIGVFRPSTHLFYLDYNGNGLWNGAATDRLYNFGIVGDSPVTGNW